MSPEKKPKISVCVMTYNQDHYIRQCLQSIVEQKTDFDFEVIVGEDCSTDGTRAIVQEFAEQYPRLVMPIYQTKNIGRGHNNYITIHREARGEYIANLDGDDYCLPGKLQAQADYLDCNPLCSIVWHRMNILNQTTGVMTTDCVDKTMVDTLKYYKKDLLMIGSIGCHSSKMYRASAEFKNFRKDTFIDFFSDIQHIGQGYAVILGNVYGVYRRGIGISTGTKSTETYLSHLCEFMQEYPDFRHEIAANAFVVFLASIKNFRRLWIKAFLIWIKVNPLSLIKCLTRLIPILINFRKRNQIQLH